MPFERPTLPELIDQGAAEFESRLPGVLARVRRSLVGVINRVIAGGLSGLYQYAEWLNAQAWPDSCAASMLAVHGARWGVTRNAATPAQGVVALAGTEGAAAPAGTVVQRTDGLQYVTLADAVIASGAALVAAEAVTAAAAGNAVSGIALQLTSPISGITSQAQASTAFTGGSDTEADEAYRARILRRIRQVPQGGSASDYEGWALEVPGVTRAWVSTGELGAGSVVVRVVRDDDAPSIIPGAAALAAVQTHIDALRPVTAHAVVVAPRAEALNVTVRLVPNTAAVRAAVLEELRDLLRREAEPGGTLLLSHVREAVSIAAGETDHAVIAPATDLECAAGVLLTMGTMHTWV